MSDEVFQAIAHAPFGYVEAPAGCGKTEAIVKTVGAYCCNPQLILTHTHAGVDALRQRFRKHQVPASRFHVDTIAGWAWSWVRRYPGNADYRGSTELAEWNDVYATMSGLLQKDFVRQGVLNSYAGVIVDEYQDCTIPMHQLIIQLKSLLPCRILGDELQGIFGFGDDQLVGWSDVQSEFATNLGALETPHRWIKAGNSSLGQWLLGTRPGFRRDREPDFRCSPIERRTVAYKNLGAALIGLTHDKEGRVCVIGPKSRPLPAGIQTTLVNRSYRVLEPNELSALRKLIQPLSDGSPHQKAIASGQFIDAAYGSVSVDDKAFIAKILKGEKQQPRRSDRKTLYEFHAEGTTPHLLLALLEYTEQQSEVNCKLRESVSALKCILEEHIDTGADLKALYADEVSKRKYQSRSNIFRCIGSTLLVKGLEFDHAVIIRGQNWGGCRDLYVALTRGSKSVTLLELSNPA